MGIGLTLALCWVGARGGQAQEERGPDQRQKLREVLIRRFDADGNGRLSESERESMKTAIQARRTSAPDLQDSSLRGLYGQTKVPRDLVQKDIELRDTSRGKTVPCRVTYPSGSGKFPVIVWSHGLYGSQEFYQPLVRYWAEHGYLVLQPSHSDSVLHGNGDLTKGKAMSTRDWASRPQDISFLIDSLTTSPELKTHADPTRIGVGGHSFGAHTTMLVGGAEPVVGAIYSDPRPEAFLAISPQGGSRLLNKNSWLGFTRPMLFISGDNDESQGGEKASWRLEPFQGAPAGRKYLMWVKDAYHNFGGISGVIRTASGPANPDQVEVVRSATLAFWDAYLKSDATASRAVTSGQLGAEGSSLFQWQTK